MLFTKKIRFSIEEKHIKEEILSKDGVTVVKLNLRYPEIVCPKRDPLSQYARSFYEKTAKSFAEYARTELKNSAEKVLSSQDEKFRPFSAVMRYEKTFESDSYLSFWIDMSVSNGIDLPVTERLTQVWDRKNGRLCKAVDFVDSHYVDSCICGSSDVKKRTKRSIERFVLRGNCIEIFIRDGEGYTSIDVPLSL